MLERSLDSYILFGTTLFYLQTVQPGYGVEGDGQVLENIDRFLENLDELGLVVTQRATYELTEIKSELVKATAKRLTADQAKRLEKIADEIRNTLFAEAAGMKAYIVSERRFATGKLVSRIGDLFGDGVFKHLPTLAQQDFIEAGKCLAFERPTAAAFHMLRGIESILRHYYCLKVKRKRVTLLWGMMIGEMEKAPNKFPKTLVSHLDHIRDSFRNPTAHPEKIYDLDEAQDLLSICMDVANRMVQDLKASALI